MLPVMLAQAGAAVPSTPWELIMASTPLTRGVLVFLAFLSAVSWTIIFAKWIELRRAERTGREFLREFEHAPALAEAMRRAAKRKQSAFTRVLERANSFLTETAPALAATPDRQARLSAAQVEALRQVVDSQIETERDGLARFVPWLATIGTVSPLIGLLGTVLGIITAFIGISTSGAGNIGAVAPGVAEALTATAMALAVAIPAFFGYNFFASRLNRIEGELSAFGSELVALLVREGRI